MHGSLASGELVEVHEARPVERDDWVGAYPFEGVGEAPGRHARALDRGTPAEAGNGADGLAMLLGLAVAVPLANDLVLLPVTLAHDVAAGG
jgi:hypothetical protein